MSESTESREETNRPDGGVGEARPASLLEPERRLRPPAVGRGLVG